MKNLDFTLLARWLKTTIIGKIEILFAFLFASILIVGHLLTINSMIDITGLSLGLGTLYFISGIVLMLVFLYFLSILKKIILNKSLQKNKIFLGNISNKKLWVYFSLGIWICYLPIVLLSNSVLTPDSWNGISQITGDTPLTNAHPVIFTAFTGIFIKTGLFFGSFELGTILYSLVQSLLLAMIFARILIWMRTNGANSASIFGTLFFYAILPINATAGIIMWKDVLFAGFGLILLMLLIDLYREKDKFFTRQNIGLFLIAGFLFCTWRNNGLYAYVLFVIIAAIVNYRFVINKKFLSLLLAPIVLVMVYTILTLSIPRSSSLGESMSVPLQQIARTVAYHGNNLSQEDINTIDEILPVDELDDKYNPGLSDPVKSSFDTEAFKENEAKYALLWGKLLIDHSKTFVAATLYNTFGYIYPYHPSPTTTDILMDNDIHFNTPNGYTDYPYEYGGKRAVAKFQDVITSTIPVVNNIGFYTCIILIGLYIALVKRNHEVTGAFLLLLTLFLTTILGPVNGEFRYLYLFAVATPLILTSALKSSNLIKEKGVHD